MKTYALAGAVALAAMLMPVAVQADDPHDPAMRDPAARARDKAMTRKLNEDQLAYVRARDAQYADGWRAWKEAQDRKARRDTRSSDDD